MPGAVAKRCGCAFNLTWLTQNIDNSVPVDLPNVIKSTGIVAISTDEAGTVRHGARVTAGKAGDLAALLQGICRHIIAEPNGAAKNKNFIVKN